MLDRQPSCLDSLINCKAKASCELYAIAAPSNDKSSDNIFGQLVGVKEFLFTGIVVFMRSMQTQLADSC